MVNWPYGWWDFVAKVNISEVSTRHMIHTACIEGSEFYAIIMLTYFSLSIGIEISIQDFMNEQ